MTGLFRWLWRKAMEDSTAVAMACLLGWALLASAVAIGTVYLLVFVPWLGALVLGWFAFRLARWAMGDIGDD